MEAKTTPEQTQQRVPTVQSPQTNQNAFNV